MTDTTRTTTSTGGITVQPNGPGCPPTCRQGADAEMVVP